MQVIAQAENGKQAIALFEEQPDVTLMDLRMPEVEEFAIGAICATTKSARIIVLTTCMIVTKISIEDCRQVQGISVERN